MLFLVLYLWWIFELMEVLSVLVKVMVGERGPEMFVPNTGGRIVPNSDEFGSTNVVVNVDASGSSVEGDEAQRKGTWSAYLSCSTI